MNSREINPISTESTQEDDKKEVEEKDSYDLSFPKGNEEEAPIEENDTQVIENDGWKLIEKQARNSDIKLPDDMLEHID